MLKSCQCFPFVHQIYFQVQGKGFELLEIKIGLIFLLI